MPIREEAGVCSGPAPHPLTPPPPRLPSDTCRQEAERRPVSAHPATAFRSSGPASKLPAAPSIAARVPVPVFCACPLFSWSHLNCFHNTQRPAPRTHAHVRPPASSPAVLAGSGRTRPSSPAARCRHPLVIPFCPFDRPSACTLSMPPTPWLHLYLSIAAAALRAFCGEAPVDSHPPDRLRFGSGCLRRLPPLRVSFYRALINARPLALFI